MLRAWNLCAVLVRGRFTWISKVMLACRGEVSVTSSLAYLTTFSQL